MSNEEKILEVLTNLSLKVDSIDKRLNTIEVDIKDVKERVFSIESKLDELESKNAISHIDTMESLNKIQSDVDFLTHKENQTEKTLFNLERKVFSNR